MKRDIKRVIRRIKDNVPEENVVLIMELNKLLRDSIFSAPESTVLFDKLQECLIDYLGYKDLDVWGIKIWSIFTDQTYNNIESMLEEINKLDKVNHNHE